MEIIVIATLGPTSIIFFISTDNPIAIIDIINRYLEQPKGFLNTLKRFKKSYPCECYKKMLVYTLKG